MSPRASDQGQLPPTLSQCALPYLPFVPTLLKEEEGPWKLEP